MCFLYLKSLSSLIATSKILSWLFIGGVWNSLEFFSYAIFLEGTFFLIIILCNANFLYVALCNINTKKMDYISWSHSWNDLSAITFIHNLGSLDSQQATENGLYWSKSWRNFFDSWIYFAPFAFFNLCIPINAFIALVLLIQDINFITSIMTVKEISTKWEVELLFL